MDIDESPYGNVDGLICLAHITDPYLRSNLNQHRASEDACEVCPGSSPTLVSLSDISTVVGEAAHFWYADPVEELYYDSREGGYQGEVLDTEDVLANICDSAFEDAVSVEIIKRLFTDGGG